MDELDTTHAGQASAGALLRLASPLRIAGFSLYNFWLLATFYNTYLFVSAPDFREVLYLNHILSLVVLTLTLAIFPLVKGHADKWVLSWVYTRSAGAVIAVSTALLAFVDSGSALGIALIVLSSIGTGFASGILFLGWGRLYADVGPRLAMFEIGATWVIAGMLAAAASLAPAPAATIVTVVGSFASAILLRKAAFNRPPRPRPAHEHRLQRRTRRMFARGLVACAGMGAVSGFSDVLTGFRFIEVPPYYATFLALSCTIVAALMAAVALASKHDFVAHAYRIVTMLLTIGCLLTSFVAQTFALSNIVIFGAYSCFVTLLCVVCIDISNYFDQPATRTFGLAIATLYAGEVVGIVFGHLATNVLHADPEPLSVVASVLTLVVVFANLFLFTEKDLTETSLGEMTDDDTPFDVDHAGAWAGCRAVGGAGCASGCVGAGTIGNMLAANGAEATGIPSGIGLGILGQEQRISCITALFVERYGLTPREADVLPLVIKGRTIARIQEELHISQGTVSTHTRHIYQKAGVHNRQALLDMLDDIPEKDLIATLRPATTG